MKCSHSIDFFSFRYLPNNFTMFILKIIVDLLTPKSFIMVIKLCFSSSVSNTNYILLLILIISSYTLTMDIAYRHFSTLSGFPSRTLVLYLSLSIIDLIISFFTSSSLNDILKKLIFRSRQTRIISDGKLNNYITPIIKRNSIMSLKS